MAKAKPFIKWVGENIIDKQYASQISNENKGYYELFCVRLGVYLRMCFVNDIMEDR